MILFWWVTYSFPIRFIYERLNFWYFSWVIYYFLKKFIYKAEFLIFFADLFWFLVYFNRLLRNESIYYFLLIRFIVSFLFFILLEAPIYDPAWFGFNLWHLYYNKWTQSKTNSPPFINVSIRHPERSDGKISSITSSAFSLLMIYMLSLFEHITCSSSLPLKEKKLIAAVNWFSHLSDFRRPFMMVFQHGLLLLRYSSVGNVSFLSRLLSYSV